MLLRDAAALRLCFTVTVVEELVEGLRVVLTERLDVLVAVLEGVFCEEGELERVEVIEPLALSSALRVLLALIVRVAVLLPLLVRVLVLVAVSLTVPEELLDVRLLAVILEVPVRLREAVDVRDPVVDCVDVRVLVMLLEEEPLAVFVKLALAVRDTELVAVEDFVCDVVPVVVRVDVLVTVSLAVPVEVREDVLVRVDVALPVPDREVVDVFVVVPETVDVALSRALRVEEAVGRNEFVAKLERVLVRVDVPDIVGSAAAPHNSRDPTLSPFNSPSYPSGLKAIRELLTTIASAVARSEGPPPARPSDKNPSKKQRRFILLWFMLFVFTTNNYAVERTI